MGGGTGDISMGALPLQGIMETGRNFLLLICEESHSLP